MATIIASRTNIRPEPFMPLRPVPITALTSIEVFSKRAFCALLARAHRRRKGRKDGCLPVIKQWVFCRYTISCLSIRQAAEKGALMAPMIAFTFAAQRPG